MASKELKKVFSKLKKLKVLVIGDTIIDEYVFATPKGRAIKDPILSTKFNDREFYLGGALAVANHIAGFVKEVTLVTLIGDKRHSFPVTQHVLRKFLKDNVRLKVFWKQGAYTTLKTRFISPYRFEKLFKMEYMSDEPISLDLTEKIINFIRPRAKKADLTVVADFGHGFINYGIRNILPYYARFMAVNAQSNSSNMCYNYFTGYKRTSFLSLSEEELRMPLQMRFEPIKEVMLYAQKKLNLNKFIVTLGKRGSIYCDGEGKLYKASVLTKKSVDTMGAGDALFAITSLLTYVGTDPNIIPFIGNAAGGYIANSLGNKESITPNKLIKFVGENKNDG